MCRLVLQAQTSAFTKAKGQLEISQHTYCAKAKQGNVQEVFGEHYPKI